MDHYLASEYGIEVGDAEAYAKWRNGHQPFHWFVEFYGIMNAGGFDVVIGNPPYVSIKKIPYCILSSADEVFPDIYGHILSKSLALTTSNGRCGMIIPLSITFSRDFDMLRANLRDWGAGWFSSYDNIPAALFSGVSQRCTIWIGHNSALGVFGAPMYRWRAAYRAYLLKNLAYVSISDLDLTELGLPKLGGAPEKAVLRALASSQFPPRRNVVPDGRIHRVRLGFSQAARNFISVFLDDPPCLDARSLAEVPPSKIGHIGLADAADSYAALAATAGELFFWYWLVRGDGFDVTGWAVRQYLEILEFLPDEHYGNLIELGRMLHLHRNRWLVFKKNAGRYVGNFNYRGAFRITRRADLLILNGLSRSRGEALAVFSYVQRVLSINEYAGEKGIPSSVKELFAITEIEDDGGANLVSVIDRQLIQDFSFQKEEFDFIINHDVNLGRNEEPEVAT